MKVPPSFYKILVLGDYCIDVYNLCRITRVNPEDQSTPLVSVYKTFTKEGMAGNVNNCLRNLGFITDLKVPNSLPSIKTRYIDTKTNKQLLRVDEDRLNQIQPINISKIDLSQYSLVVVADYNKGAITSSELKWLDTRCRELNKPLLIDSKKSNLLDYTWATFKINEAESLVANYNINSTIITHGADGAVYLDKTYPAYLPKKIIDVCGAGDAFMAGLIYGYLCAPVGKSNIEYAIVNAGLSVEHLGVYGPTLEELEEGMFRYEQTVRNS